MNNYPDKIMIIFILLAIIYTFFYIKSINNTFKRESNDITLLFNNDGCKVYRFEDKDKYHYYTNCTSTISIISNGKTSYEETIGKGR